ncbi:coat protein [Gaeumannomyces tritici partitivirus 1]|nr:coat protein [Gaeumannomyces tritici partitivirus 1]
MSDNKEIVATVVPEPNAPTGNLASLPAGRNLAAEKAAEVAADTNAAKAKSDRFTVRKVAARTTPQSSGPEYESYILKAAANNPLSDVDYPAVSTFVPNSAVLFYVLAFMDQLMSSTKRWFDNSAGWAPPISQMYISVLFYYQVMRAQHAAGNASGDMVQFLILFEQIFPLSELWIPGPLVAAFRALSAFRPDQNDLFGGVTPALPNQPGWSANRGHSLADHVRLFLPNISFMLSRLRDVADLSVTGITDAEWLNHTNGPNHIESLNGHAAAHNANYDAMVTSPSLKFALSGERFLWRNAHARFAFMQVPARLNANAAVRNTWTSFLFFEDNQHHWFGNVSAIMAKYCQFFEGSRPISELVPVNSAAGALKLRISHPPSTIHTPPVFNAAAGAGNNHQHGHAAQVNHYTCAHHARVVIDANLAVRDVPDAHTYSALTFCYNAYFSNASQAACRAGPFWDLGPDTKSVRNAEILPGVFSTIMREYHSDTRIPAHKQ